MTGPEYGIMFNSIPCILISVASSVDVDEPRQGSHLSLLVGVGYHLWQIVLWSYMYIHEYGPIFMGVYHSWVNIYCHRKIKMITFDLGHTIASYFGVRPCGHHHHSSCSLSFL